MGESILIRQAPEINVNAYTVGLTGGITYQPAAAASLEMTIDHAVYTAVQLDDIDKFQSDIGLMNMYAQDASERLKINVDKVVLGYMAGGQAGSIPADTTAAPTCHASNAGATAGVVSASIDLGTDVSLSGADGPLQIVGNSTESAAANRYSAVDMIVRMGQVLDEQNIPAADRWVVIPPWYATKLKTSELKQANITGDATGVIRTGLIGTLNGMKIFVNNHLSKGLTDTSATWVLAGTKAATSFAMGLSKSETGRLEGSFGDYMRNLWVYGVKTVRPEAFCAMLCESTDEV